MAPYYNPSVAVPQFDDDIPRVEARYGKDQAKPDDPVKPPPTDTDDEEVFHVRCKNLQVEGYTLFANE